MNIIEIDVTKIGTWDEFHDYFANQFKFPIYYGRNMNAWIDCMEDCVVRGDFIVLSILGMSNLKERNRDIFDAINECSAFINYRAKDSNGRYCIALCYS